MPTDFQYQSRSARLTTTQENYIRAWWPFLAAGSWAYFLKAKKIPAVIIDGRDLNSPNAAQPTGLFELLQHLRQENPGLNPVDVLADFRPENGVAVLFYADNRATHFVTLSADLSPPLAWELWEQENEQSTECVQ